MNNRKVFLGSSPKLKRILLAVFLLTMFMSSVPTREAAAWTYTYTGNVGVIDYPDQLDVGDMTPYYFTVISREQMLVYRNPAYTGTQLVKAVYLLEEYVRTTTGVYVWQTVKYQEHSWQIDPSAFYIAPLPIVRFDIPASKSGYFRVRYSISWKTTSGAILGSTQIIPNQPSDYLCSFSNRPCQSYAGYFRIGKYGTNSW